jgi:hypothetical protein|tara:strand:- start:28577 stop:28912 length:336 start_codon:yes stop_codon:yes gene_type:complete
MRILFGFHPTHATLDTWKFPLSQSLTLPIPLKVLSLEFLFFASERRSIAPAERGSMGVFDIPPVRLLQADKKKEAAKNKITISVLCDKLLISEGLKTTDFSGGKGSKSRNF